MSREFKVGDRVVCLNGTGTVKAVNPDSIYQITVELDDGWRKTFLDDGRCQPSCNFPTLFHIDEKPSQWVVNKKVGIKQWANIYKGKMHLYATEDGAKRYARPEAIAIAVKMEGEYAIEE